MTLAPWEFMLVTFGVSLAAGAFGAMLGLGGGIIVVPALTLLLGVDIRYAVGASIVSVIATSSGAGAIYVRRRLTNIRVAMLLETATTTGGVLGAFVAGFISERWLYLIFAAVLTYTTFRMLRHRERSGQRADPPGPISRRLRLQGRYTDPAVGKEIEYHASHAGWGLAVSGFAGVISGLLGVGGGIIKVPAMNVVMGLPLKVASATSNFMIGVTAAASAGVYFMRGNINPFIAAPVALGVLLGVKTGARLLSRLHSQALRWIFVAVLAVVAIQMIWKGLR